MQHINNLYFITSDSFQLENLKGKNQTRHRRTLTMTLIMVSGLIVILLLPSIVFYYNEDGWTYLDSVYYALVSLSTRGLGNLTNSHDNDQMQLQEGKWRWVYQAFTLLWFIMGISFSSMLNTFIAVKIRQTSKKHQTILREEKGQKENSINRRRSDPGVYRVKRSCVGQVSTTVSTSPSEFSTVCLNIPSEKEGTFVWSEVVYVGRTLCPYEKMRFKIEGRLRLAHASCEHVSSVLHLIFAQNKMWRNTWNEKFNVCSV